MTLRIAPKRFAYVLTLGALSLACVNIAIHFCIYILGYDQLLEFARPFTFRGNSTVAKWFATANLLLCTLLLAIIARGKIQETDGYRHHWSALALIFCAISLEEAVGLHELTSKPLSSVFPATGLLFHTWVVLGVLFTAIVALIYARFLGHLPSKTKRLFLLAATLYVGGALGMEIIRGPYNEAYGAKHMIAEILKSIEEIFQMLGVVVFIYTLLSYIGEHIKEVTLYIDNKASKIVGFAKDQP
jgi:hypothetical protein